MSERGRIPTEVLEAYHASPQGVRDSVTPSATSPLPTDGPPVEVKRSETVVELPEDKGATVTQLPKAKTKQPEMVEGEYTADEVIAWCESKGKPIKRHGNGTVKGLHLFRAAVVKDRGPKLVAKTG